MVKNNTGRKLTELDRLGIPPSACGIYAILPFNNLSKDNKACFKVGMTASGFAQRFDSYHTSFPMGMYMVCFLQNPPVRVATRSNITKKQHYLKIEAHVFKFLTDHHADRIYSTTRVFGFDQGRQAGTSEYFYTDENTLHLAFEDAYKKFGGILSVFPLSGLDENNKYQDFTKQNDKTLRNSMYVGKIGFN